MGLFIPLWLPDPPRLPTGQLAQEEALPPDESRPTAAAQEHPGRGAGTAIGRHSSWEAADLCPGRNRDGQFQRETRNRIGNRTICPALLQPVIALLFPRSRQNPVAAQCLLESPPFHSESLDRAAVYVCYVLSAGHPGGWCRRQAGLSGGAA